MWKFPLMLVATGLCLSLAGTSSLLPVLADEKPRAALDADQTQLVERVFAGRLLEIAAEYQQYERVDQTMRWSPSLCFLPPEASNPPKNLGLISQSTSDATHGKKLYFLYARKPSEYRNHIWRLSSNTKQRAPLGQVLVKEAWHPIKKKKLEPARIGNTPPATKSSNPHNSKPFAVHGQDKYHAGDKKGLFIMFKTLESTPGTDQGWVYGTVSADAKRVLSVGRLKNCMQCHREAAYDRQIGILRMDKLPSNTVPMP